MTVTVGVAGALVRLSFGPKADQMPKERLASLVMSTARRAQAQAAGQISAIMEPLIGADSDAMHFVNEQIPAVDLPDETEESPPMRRLATLNEDQEGRATRTGTARSSRSHSR